MKICCVYSDRSEYSILRPFMEYLQKHTYTRSVDLSKVIKNIHDDRNLYKIYDKCYEIFSTQKFDFVCILGDRRELPFVVLAAFFLNVKIVHIAAGEFVEGKPTYDQIIRPIITLYSSLQICFSHHAKRRVIKLFKGTVDLEPNTFFIGSPVFKGINIRSLKRIIKEKYDLVLLHPQSLSRYNTMRDIESVKRILKKRNKKTIFISGNKDRNFDLIESFYDELKTWKKNYSFVNSLPKREYFKLVRYCDNFYTNSSSISEIRYLNKNCYRQIGVRNKGRPKHEFNNRAPEKLYILLKSTNEKLIRKHQNLPL